MKRMLILGLCTIISIEAFSASTLNIIIRGDLTGKPLMADDFAIIVDNHLVKAFISQNQILALFPDAKKKESDLWQWSALHDSGPMVLKNIEYKTKSVRLVYIEDVVNEYTGLAKGALTIRGVGVGDSIDSVLLAYGKNDWLEAHKNPTNDVLKKGNIGFSYRFYNYPDTMNNKYPSFDYIHFEIKDGVVVGIHYWRERSDAP